MKFFGKLILVVALGLGGLFLFGPYEPVDLTVEFNESTLAKDPEGYLTTREAVFDDIEAGAHKRILWSGAKGEKTPLSIVYIHGFSASAEEIRPVPDRVAEALGANLFFTRLAGHGRRPEAMATPTVNDWMIDFAEAMAVGRAIGDEVIIISTSTGGTISALGALDADHSRALKGIVFVSPNFAVNNPAAPLLTFPAARHWVPLIVGETRSFEPLNARQAAHWTESYPTLAVFPMGAIVKAAYGADYSNVTVPAHFIFSEKDQVVSPAATKEIMSRWGGDVSKMIVTDTDGDSSSHHVIAGDIVSPAGTDPAVASILAWLNNL